ncbi:uncharacterized protein LOC118785368 [Megalops cyprinoides]|uniref:uncharacterized protein LOC118785368 n=1 Tax=Megalops cyprinoides TaxID=118141 RepID=UPI001864F740|nr:uncharacterized protein LOC118785368 [Megalops cyprinoides]
MASHSRFKDEKYKNWLKTTMSLQLLRCGLGTFLENETETFHDSLRNKLKEATCKLRCDFKKPKDDPWKMTPPLCEDCGRWRDEIRKHHKGGLIYWNNSTPSRWSSDKWEVAKVYMPRGNRNHSKLDQFDISAFLNLMTSCKHFNKFVKEKVITEVTNVRNQMMHSPDMKVAKEDMENHLRKILGLVSHLQVHIPDMEVLCSEINQLEKTELNVMLEGQDTSRDASKTDVIKNLRDVQKMQDLEQQVLKEKIETLAFRLEEDKGLAKTEEFLGMKEFLDQNKDLLVQLGPQVEKLNMIQEKVDQHDVQLNALMEKVDQLEKNVNEPVFSADVVKYKNHLFEEARKNKWPDPEFKEIRKPQGYIGQVVVNGQTFTGDRVHPKVKAAHQEVAKIALEQLRMQPSAMEEGSLSVRHTDQSETSTSQVYFCDVTVDLNTEIVPSEGHCKEEAIQSAYKILASKFSMDVSAIDAPYKPAVHGYFKRCGFQRPEEILHTGADEKVYCKLKLSGHFTFQGQEGASKKKLAEQQAAKVALRHLSGVLGHVPVTGENYKSALKELMEAKSLPQPSYSIPQIQTTERKAAAEHPNPASVASSIQFPESRLTQRTVTDAPELLQRGPASQVTIPATPVDTHECSVSSGNPLFFAAVKVPVNTVFEGPEADSKEDAVEEAYRGLEQALTLRDAATGSTTGSARQQVHDFFSRAECAAPVEECVNTTEGRFRCTLKICGDLTFQNPVAASKKQQAEQAAAKEALLRLAGVLKWDHDGLNENCKGKLQELLIKQGLKPTYLPVPRTGDTEKSSGSAASANSSAGDPTPEAGASDSNAKTLAMAPADSGHLPPNSKVPRVEFPEILSMLEMSGYRAPTVNCEGFGMEQWFKLRVEIQLANYTFQNQQGYNNKKDATRSTYLKFGQATKICGPSTDESQSTGAVKQYFAQKALSPPTEEFVKKDNKFYCSLKVDSCSFPYEGEGPSEEEARQDASKNALSQLAPLFGCELAAKVSSKEAEESLKLMLKEAHQESPVFHNTATLHRATVEVLFNAFTLESKGQNNKKQARNQLSARILGLLGEEGTEMSSNVSARNRVDDWFKQKGISPPVFEDTEGLGAKATFSVSITCSPQGWQPSSDAAVRKLKEELQTRLQYLTVEDPDQGL